MAWGRNKEVVETISADELQELQQRAEKFAPDKLVIVAGPTFGTILKFILLGAAIGAAGVVLLQGKNASATDADYEDVAAGGTVRERNLKARAEALLRRAKTLAGNVREAAAATAEGLKPAFQEAVEEAKITAEKTEQELKAELDAEK